MPEEPRSPATVASAEPTPVALRDYYEGRTPLKQLFGSATPPPADAQDQTQAKTLLADLGGCDPDLRKTVRLTSGRVNLPQWLQAWCRTIVERELGAALDPEESCRGFGLRRLFKRSQEGVTAKDASTRRRAYNLLRLSLVCVHSVRQLDPTDLAEEAMHLVFPEGRSRFRGRDLERNAVTPLLRATSAGTLKKVLLSLRFWMEWARTARADVFTAKEKADRLTSKVSELQKELSTAHETIQSLQAQVADSAERVTTLSRDLETEHNRRINKMREAKGRMRRLFDSALAPRLRGAREALDGDPIAVNVALERLERTLQLLEEERPWLSSD